MVYLNVLGLDLSVLANAFAFELGLDSLHLGFAIIGGGFEFIDLVVLGRALGFELGLNGFHLGLALGGGGFERVDLGVLGVGFAFEFLDLVLAVEAILLEIGEARGGSCD